MPIQMACPECGQRLTIPEGAVGKKVRCQKCSHVFVAETKSDPQPPPPMELPEPPPIVEANETVPEAEINPGMTGITTEANPLAKASSMVPSPLDADTDGEEKASPKRDGKNPLRKPASGSGKLFVLVGDRKSVV